MLSGVVAAMLFRTFVMHVGGPAPDERIVRVALRVSVVSIIDHEVLNRVKRAPAGALAVRARRQVGRRLAEASGETRMVHGIHVCPGTEGFMSDVSTILCQRVIQMTRTLL